MDTHFGGSPIIFLLFGALLIILKIFMRFMGSMLLMLCLAEFMQFFNVGASDLFTQNYLSDLFDNVTVSCKSESASTNRNFYKSLKNTGHSFQDSKTNLLSKSDIQIMADSNLIVIFNTKKHVHLC